MKYYQIGLDVEVTGVKNGLYQVEIDKKALSQDNAFHSFFTHFNSQNSMFWHEQDKVQTLKVPVIKAKLLKNARVTDIMGYTPNISFLDGLYSEKYVNILKAFNIGKHGIFEVDIEKVIQKYYMLFIEMVPSDQINYEKSIVVTGYKVSNNIKYHNIDNREDYRTFKQANPLARFEKIAIPNEYLGKDIIDVQASNKRFYSEKLIDFLLDCGITGMRVEYENSIQLEFV